MEPQTLQTWYERQYSTLTTQGQIAKAILLRKSYFNTREYGIHLRTECSPINDHSLIIICTKLYQSLCWQYRIP